jgi:hypothetical protein
VDAEQFDAMAKAVRSGASRRGLLAGLLGVGLMMGPSGVVRVVAKNTPKKPKRCKKSTCATGCCAVGTCVIGEYDVCGTGGEACISCSAAVGLHCNVGQCECRPGRGCCIRDETVPTPDPCTACCSGSCLGGNPINGCAKS